MATRKSNASRTVPTRAPTAPKSRKSRSARSRSFDATKLVGPGAALLVTGALTAAGYVLRQQLADVLTSVLKTATTEGAKAVAGTSKVAGSARDDAMDAVERITDTISVASLLGHAGLQRRGMWMSIVGPTVGVMCGFVAGAAVTHFFGPQLLELAGASASPEAASARMETPPDAFANSKPAPSAVMDGAAQRGVS
jgi:hypothetical protein